MGMPRAESGGKMTTIPTLTTSRLTLRQMRAEDWLGYHRFMASDHSIYMGGPFTLAQSWGMFCSDHAQWSLFGFGALMIDETASGKCLGQVAINSGPLFPEFELGWLLFPEAQGNGFAYEAAAALRAWSRDAGQIETLVSYVDPENAGSARLAERLGATLDATAQRPDPSDLVYRHFG